LAQLTTREKIIEILRSTSRPLTADELAMVLGSDLTAKDIYEHLSHVAKTLRSRSKGLEVLVMDPRAAGNADTCSKTLINRRSRVSVLVVRASGFLHRGSLL